mgnify:CR=1 FL=1
MFPHRAIFDAAMLAVIIGIDRLNEWAHYEEIEYLEKEIYLSRIKFSDDTFFPI